MPAEREVRSAADLGRDAAAGQAADVERRSRLNIKIQHVEGRGDHGRRDARVDRNVDEVGERDDAADLVVGGFAGTPLKFERLAVEPDDNLVDVGAIGER
ncbi:MAG: hypothetical protein NTX73_03935 [Rhodobacterales bacterium]|nr:hypothetical protein [Rhodobacterales bacterium]